MKLALCAVAARHPQARAGASAALQPSTLSIAAGEHVAVVGASGAGKTTLLQVLALAMQPSAGSLLVGGVDPWTLPRGALQRLRGRLFLAPQVPPLPPRQRVVTAVLAGRLPAMGLLQSVRSLLHPTDAAAAHAALAQFDLADKLFDRVDRLSGGERQRVGLARALLAPASLWLVDEPLSALDPARAQQALQALLQVARERGITLVASLHQVELALAHFPRIVGLQGGRVAFDLPAAAVTPERLAQLYARAGGGPLKRSTLLAPRPATRADDGADTGEPTAAERGALQLDGGSATNGADAGDPTANAARSSSPAGSAALADHAVTGDGALSDAFDGTVAADRPAAATRLQRDLHCR